MAGTAPDSAIQPRAKWEPLPPTKNSFFPISILNTGSTRGSLTGPLRTVNRAAGVEYSLFTHGYFLGWNNELPFRLYLYVIANLDLLHHPLIDDLHLLRQRSLYRCGQAWHLNRFRVILQRMGSLYHNRIPTHLTEPDRAWREAGAGADPGFLRPPDKR